MLDNIVVVRFLLAENHNWVHFIVLRQFYCIVKRYCLLHFSSFRDLALTSKYTIIEVKKKTNVRLHFAEDSSKFVNFSFWVRTVKTSSLISCHDDVVIPVFSMVIDRSCRRGWQIWKFSPFSSQQWFTTSSTPEQPTLFTSIRGQVRCTAVVKMTSNTFWFYSCMWHFADNPRCSLATRPAGGARLPVPVIIIVQCIEQDATRKQFDELMRSSNNMVSNPMNEWTED